MALGAVAIWEGKRERELGEQILDHIGAEENDAVAQLFSASLETRTAFLTRALNTDPEKVRVNEQGLSVADAKIRRKVTEAAE